MHPKAHQTITAKLGELYPIHTGKFAVLSIDMTLMDTVDSIDHSRLTILSPATPQMPAQSVTLNLGEIHDLHRFLSELIDEERREMATEPRITQ